MKHGKNYRYSVEEFDRYLNSFNENNTALIFGAIRLVTSNGLWSELCSDISDYRKQSLVRKVLRYVAQTALKGTFEIDGLAVSTAFHAMENGYPVSFGTNTEWSFWSKILNQKINVEVDEDDELVTFYDEYHNFLTDVKLWNGCHWTTMSGKVDLVQFFEDWARRTKPFGV